MKKKITFPDWTGMAGQLITRNSENDLRPLWKEYNQSPADDFLSLRVTLEITGGSTLFETFESEEARNAAYMERSRQITWRNAARQKDLCKSRQATVMVIGADQRSGQAWRSQP